MNSNNNLVQFKSNIREEVDEYVKESEYTHSQSTRDAGLACIYMQYLEESGVLFDPFICPYEDLEGRNRCRVSGYLLLHENSELYLFLGHEVRSSDNLTLPANELRSLCMSAVRFFTYASKGDIEHFSESTVAQAACKEIHDSIGRIESAKVFLFTDGISKKTDIDDIEFNNIEIKFEIYDLKRMERIASAGSVRPDIVINFEDYMGRPLPCLRMDPPPKDYQTYLAMFPGELLYQLYDKFGSQLMEFNVRSYLQARGGVNKGIIETLKDEPERFMAYNNGLTITADEIDAIHHYDKMAIKKIVGMQIVNGGQTTASIHRAKKIMKMDISRVYVPVKITHVEPNFLKEFVPLISKYSNTQNVIQVADLSANHEFHIKMEQISEATWCPGEKTRWFYERARGAYQVWLNKRGTTKHRLKEAKSEIPTYNKITKTDLAKYIMTWLGRPQSVSQGAQKNFATFMAELPSMYPENWQPDQAYFKDCISKCILFKKADKLVRQAGHPYKANIVTYLVAYLSYRENGQFNFAKIWQKQDISEELKQTLGEWCNYIYSSIIETAKGRNISEWCKKNECWEEIKKLELPLKSPKPEEFIATTEEDETEEHTTLAGTIVDSYGDSLEFCKSLSKLDYARIYAWGMETDRLSYWERGVAHTLGEMANAGWKKDPSKKQIRHALRAIELASNAGIINLD